VLRNYPSSSRRCTLSQRSCQQIAIKPGNVPDRCSPTPRPHHAANRGALQHCRSGFALPSGKGSDPLSEKADQKRRGGFGSEAASAAGSGGIAVGKWREPPRQHPRDQAGSAGAVWTNGSCGKPRPPTGQGCWERRPYPGASDGIRSAVQVAAEENGINGPEATQPTLNISLQ